MGGISENFMRRQSGWRCSQKRRGNSGSEHLGKKVENGRSCRIFGNMNQLFRSQNSFAFLHDRRNFLRRVGLAAMFFTVPGAFAEELMRTPRQTEGPFYPDKLPLDTDNDLIIVNEGITPAIGEITWLSGRILDAR